MPNITHKIGVLKGAANRPGNLPTLTTAMAAEIIDVASLNTYLLANGYSAAQLALMTENDKIYAYRIKKPLPN